MSVDGDADAAAETRTRIGRNKFRQPAPPPTNKDASPTMRGRPYSSCVRSSWYGHVPRNDDDDWVKKRTEHEVEGPRPRGRPKKTRKEAAREDCQARKLNKEDAMDRCK